MKKFRSGLDFSSLGVYSGYQKAPLNKGLKMFGRNQNHNAGNNRSPYYTPNTNHRGRNRSRAFGNKRVSAIGFLIAIVAFLGIGFGVISGTHVETHSACVVTDKDRTTNSEGQSDMRVYTENCGVFSVKDSIFIMRFDSADTFSQIKVGDTYDFESRGFRVGILSQFPNITEATAVQK